MNMAEATFDHPRPPCPGPSLRRAGTKIWTVKIFLLRDQKVMISLPSWGITRPGSQRKRVVRHFTINWKKRKEKT
jgi:hypothetical protein